MAYTDQTLIQNFLHRTLNSDEITLLVTLLPTIKQWIDARLSSTFDQAAETTRFYDGGVKNLDIDPCINISQVKALNDDGSDSYIYNQTFFYELVFEPQNETVKREIRRRVGCFPSGIQRIAVTATFSEYNSGVPEDIKILATILAIGVINQGKYAAIGGNVMQESLEGHEIRYAPNAANLNGIAEGDPTVQAILTSRKELYVDIAL